MLMIRIFSTYFEVGELEVHPAVLQVLSETEVLEGLMRHLGGDWGDVTREEWEANDAARQCGGRLSSRYSTVRGTRFWITTNEERSRTVVQLPLEH